MWLAGQVVSIPSLGENSDEQIFLGMSALTPVKDRNPEGLETVAWICEGAELERATC